MILHLSLAAADPKLAAEGLAEIWNGRALPFPPKRGAWMAFADDGRGTAVEFYPMGTRLAATGDERSYRYTVGAEGLTATHVAIATRRSVEEVRRAAESRGWNVQDVERGSFRPLDVWIEDRLMFEVFPPERVEAVVASFQPESWAGLVAATERGELVFEE